MGNFHQDGLTLPPKTTSKIPQNNSFQGPGRQAVKGQDPQATGVKVAGHPAHARRRCLGCGTGRGGRAEPSDSRVAVGTGRHLFAGQSTGGESCTGQTPWGICGRRPQVLTAHTCEVRGSYM